MKAFCETNLLVMTIVWAISFGVRSRWRFNEEWHYVIQLVFLWRSASCQVKICIIWSRTTSSQWKKIVETWSFRWVEFFKAHIDCFLSNIFLLGCSLTVVFLSGLGVKALHNIVQCRLYLVWKVGIFCIYLSWKGTYFNSENKKMVAHSK